MKTARNRVYIVTAVIIILSILAILLLTRNQITGLAMLSRSPIALALWKYQLER